MSSYDPRTLSDADREALNARVGNNPGNFVRVDYVLPTPGGLAAVRGPLDDRPHALYRGRTKRRPIPMGPESLQGLYHLSQMTVTLEVSRSRRHGVEHEPVGVRHDQDWAMHHHRRWWSRTRSYWRRRK